MLGAYSILRLRNGFHTVSDTFLETINFSFKSETGFAIHEPPGESCIFSCQTGNVKSVNDT